jgi:hypothetical protein
LDLVSCPRRIHNGIVIKLFHSFHTIFWVYNQDICEMDKLFEQMLQNCHSDIHHHQPTNRPSWDWLNRNSALQSSGLIVTSKTPGPSGSPLDSDWISLGLAICAGFDRHSKAEHPHKPRPVETTARASRHASCPRLRRRDFPSFFRRAAGVGFASGVTSRYFIVHVFFRSPSSASDERCRWSCHRVLFKISFGSLYYVCSCFEQTFEMPIFFQYTFRCVLAS